MNAIFTKKSRFNTKRKYCDLGQIPQPKITYKDYICIFVSFGGFVGGCVNSTNEIKKQRKNNEYSLFKSYVSACIGYCYGCMFILTLPFMIPLHISKIIRKSLKDLE